MLPSKIYFLKLHCKPDVWAKKFKVVSKAQKEKGRRPIYSRLERAWRIPKWTQVQEPSRPIKDLLHKGTWHYSLGKKKKALINTPTGTESVLRNKCQRRVLFSIQCKQLPKASKM